MRNILECFMLFVFCYVSKHFPFYGGITSIYLKYVEYSGIFFLYLFVFFCHVLHIFLFMEAKPDIATEKLSAKSPFRRTSSCKWRDVSMQGKHLLGRKKNTCTEWENHSLMRHFMPVYIYIYIARI